MKHFAMFGLLFCLASCAPSQPNLPVSPTGSSSSSPVNNSPTPSPNSPDAQSPTPDSSSPGKNIFQSDRFGFRFQYPEGFTPGNRSENQSPGTQAALLERLEVWESQDYQAIVSGTWKGGEYPASVTISIFDNAQKRPLTAWKDDGLSRGEDKTMTVAGQEALSYASTGLYESDHVIFSSPDSRYVIHIRGAYINPDDPIRQAYQKIVSSFEFQ